MRHIDRKQNRRVRATFGDSGAQTMREFAFEDITELASFSEPWNGGREIQWCGASHGEVMEWVTKGAPHLRTRLLAMMERIQLPEDYTRPEVHRRRRRIKGDFGNELDIHACYQGRSDRAWDKLHVEQAPTEGNRLVHVCIDLVASAGVSAYDGMWRAAAAMRILEALVSMGKSIAISGYYAVRYGVMPPHGFPNNPDGDIMTSVRLKDYGQPLREDVLAAATIIPFFRQVMLTVPYGPRLRYRPTRGHGYPISDYKLKTDAAERDEDVGGSTVVIGQAFSEDMAKRTVEKFLDTYVRAEHDVKGYSARDQVINWR